jgi:hypothetical protein
MRSHYRVATAAVLLIGLSPAGGSVLSAQRATDAFEWRGTVLQGSAIEIKGVNGEVTAEPSSGPEVEVTAVKTGRRSDPSGVRIEVVTHGDGVTVCAVYPDVDGRPNECRPGDGGRMSTRDNDVNVAFTVKVPAGVRFVGRTVNGDIKTHGALAGPVSLRTVNGDAEFSTTGHGDATTVNGSVRAALGSALWQGTLSFETVNGSITVDLPADLSTDVRASTVNGDISTDFPLTVTGRVSRRSLTGTIGGGGRILELDTVNGSVQLNRR